MTFEIVLKQNIAGEIGNTLDEDELPISITVNNLDINAGLLKKGNYYIPVEHILFIKEVT